MKVLIVSDTHGHEENFEKVLEKVGNIQHLIHLGDVEGHEDYIEAISGCPVHIVAGNNDFFSDLPREEELWLEDYHTDITMAFPWEPAALRRRRGPGALI